jgi:tripartite-type tricarboxylate transporter receptor subunit TctC
MISKQSLRIGTAALCVAWSTIDPAAAQSYPSKPIKIVAPAGPGGPTDLLARILAQSAQPLLGQNMLVANIAGGGGIVAAKDVARAVPDGHTLLFGNTTLLAVIPAVSNRAGYDPGRDFAPVAKVGDSYQVLVVEQTLPVNSLQELVTYAKANPDKLNYASGGYGTVNHLVGEMLNSAAGIHSIHIPYKSDAEAINAVLGKQAHMSFINIATALPLIQEGKLKAIAVTSAARRSDLPNVLTISESGVPGYVVTSFFGVVAPAGTPVDVITKLNTAINTGLRSSETQMILGKIGAQASPGTPKSPFQNLIKGYKAFAA